jgi:hypothetical protein
MTNTILTSPDRNLFGTIIRQSTDGMLCVSDFTSMYEKQRIQKGWANKKIQHILDNKKSQEEVYYTLINANIINCDIQHFMDKCEEIGLLKVLKQYNLYNMKGRAENRAVWANPYIFVYLAMNMNPEIYGKVIVWLTDTLILNRVEAAQNFRPMTDAIKFKVGDDYLNYVKVARAINKNVFGKEDAGQRAIATTKQLDKIKELEKFITGLLDLSIIDNIGKIESVVESYKFN